MGLARAIRCAQAIVEGVHALGLEVRTGLHTGECELAGPGEVLVSSTVKALVAGSGLAFQDAARTN